MIEVDGITSTPYSVWGDPHVLVQPMAVLLSEHYTPWCPVCRDCEDPDTQMVWRRGDPVLRFNL